MFFVNLFFFFVPEIYGNDRFFCKIKVVMRGIIMHFCFKLLSLNLPLLVDP